MRLATASLALLAAGAAIAFAATPEPTGDHKMLAPSDIKWGAGPASLPTGAQAALLYGDPTKDGLFALRLKLPKGFRIAPHTHPKPEIITVISGTFRIGMGETADASKATPVPVGGFVSMSPGQAHFVAIEEETVVQLNSTGPWAVNYVNPKDDPRTKTQ